MVDDVQVPRCGHIVTRFSSGSPGDLRRTLGKNEVVMRGRGAWVLLATIVASSMVFIDGMVVNLALPSIQREFHASAAGVAWIVELYTLVLGALMLLGGGLADRYGRRKMFAAGTITFAAGSIGCAFAWSLPAMLAFRVLQGIGGMLVAPASLAILGSHFSGEARGRAIAAWSAFGALTSTIGPMIGGLLIDSLGWRSVFWINIPLAVVVMYVCARHIDETKDDEAKPLDYTGAAIVTLGLGALTYALIASGQHRWYEPQVSVTTIAGVVLIAWFVIHELRSSAPLVPPRLFGSRTFGALNLMTLAVYASLSGVFYELPFALIQVHGYNAIQTALATLPMALGLIALARVGTGLARRYGTRLVLTAGPCIVAAGFALLGLFDRHGSYFTSFFPGIMGVGIGMGITVAPLTTAVINAADPRSVGIASGINSAVSRIAGLIAVAAFTAVLFVTYEMRMSHGLDAMHASKGQRSAAAAQSDRLGGARFSDARLQRASFDAFDTGFEAVAYICCGLCVFGAVVSFTGIREESLREA